MWCFVQQQTIVVVLCKIFPNSWCCLQFPRHFAQRQHAAQSSVIVAAITLGRSYERKDTMLIFDDTKDTPAGGFLSVSDIGEKLQLQNASPLPSPSRGEKA
jgi:hypothetical protein